MRQKSEIREGHVLELFMGDRPLAITEKNG